MDYKQVLAMMHEAIAPLTYLEIGVLRGATLGLASCRAVGIDPRPRLAPEFLSDRPLTGVYETTSDGFFATQTPESVFLGMPVEMAFIDGLHTFDQVMRDFINVERWMSPRGIIFVHDVFPKHISRASRTPPASGPWCGDVWRLRDVLAELRPDLSCAILEAKAPDLLAVARLNPGHQWDDGLVASMSEGFAAESTEEYEAAFNRYRLSVNLVDPRRYLRDLESGDPRHPVQSVVAERSAVGSPPRAGKTSIER